MSLACGEDTARIAGGQEVAAQLLEQPLTCKSAEAIYVKAELLLSEKSAMTANEREEFAQSEYECAQSYDLLHQLNQDSHVAIARSGRINWSFGSDNEKFCNLIPIEGRALSKEAHDAHMRRPDLLERLTLSEYIASYQE